MFIFFAPFPVYKHLAKFSLLLADMQLNYSVFSTFVCL